MFDSVKKVMEACGHTTDQLNEEQIDLYSGLLNKELYGVNRAWLALNKAVADENPEDIRQCLEYFLKQISELMWTTAGFGYSFGLPMKEGVDRVVEANLAYIIDGKIECDPETGMVLKPEGWQPPDYSVLIERILPRMVTIH